MERDFEERGWKALIFRLNVLQGSSSKGHKNSRRLQEETDKKFPWHFNEGQFTLLENVWKIV